MILDAIPLWAVYLSILVAFLLSVELGLLLGRWRRSPEAIQEGLTAQTVTVLGALLALNGFLLGFTFSKAESQFDTRRKLVIDDVRAIETAFLRTEQLPEPQRSNSRILLGEYVDRRHLLRTGARSEILAQSQRVQDGLWAEASVVARSERTPVIAIYLQAVNQIIDLHAKRADIEEWVRVPGMVFAVLGVLTISSMVMTGYLLALRQRRWGVPTLLMVFAYATTFILILDLDRPVQGLFSVSQEPMLALRESIHATLGDEHPEWRDAG